MVEAVLASANDCFLALPLSLALAEEEGLPVQEFTAARLHADMIRDILDGKRAVWLAIHSDGEGTNSVVGTIRLQLRDDPFFGSYYECGGLYVDPGFRKGKVGRKLVEAACAAMPDDATVVLVTTGSLRHSYRRMGFTERSITSSASVSDVRKALNRS